MNCFDWENRVSDYLDGSLTSPLKLAADEHVESCASCSMRYNHYRLILSSVSNQPRNPLPLIIRKAPLSSAGVPASRNKRPRLRDSLKFWSTIPWYLRTPIISGGIVLLISLAFSAGPRLLALYDGRVERSLTEYGNEMMPGDGTGAASAARLARGNLTATAAAPGGTVEEADDFSSSEGGGDAEDDTPALKTGASQTWRFNLKTDSPHEVRAKIVEILTRLKVPATTPGIGGIEAPGGIQFDLMVPQAIIQDLKQALEKIAPEPPKELADSPFGETFTWYKKKSAKPLPAGQTHVVIWLAQI